MSYNLIMKMIYLSFRANPLLQTYLEQLGYKIEKVLDSPSLCGDIASHPDLFMCKMGSQPDSTVFFGNPKKPKTPYPGEIPYNAACTGKYFIHNLAATDTALLEKSKEMGMLLVDVSQGYTKCNTVVVDENSLITSDKGIFDALNRHLEIDCLFIQPGYVSLPGYSTGFLGGASGRVGNTILFHGNLKSHPDCTKIIDFIEARGLDVVWFEEFPLTDIGSIIEAGRCSI